MPSFDQLGMGFEPGMCVWDASIIPLGNPGNFTSIGKSGVLIARITVDCTAQNITTHCILGLAISFSIHCNTHEFGLQILEEVISSVSWKLVFTDENILSIVFFWKHVNFLIYILGSIKRTAITVASICTVKRSAVMRRYCSMRHFYSSFHCNCGSMRAQM